MRHLKFGATLLLCAVLNACVSPQDEIVGSWKRTQFLDARDEPQEDDKTGYILELNEDMTFSLRFTYQSRPRFGGSPDRNKTGTWSFAPAVVKDDQAALVLRFNEDDAVREETHRVRALTKEQLKLIYSEHTSVFTRR